MQCNGSDQAKGGPPNGAPCGGGRLANSQARRRRIYLNANHAPAPEDFLAAGNRTTAPKVCLAVGN